MRLYSMPAYSMILWKVGKDGKMYTMINTEDGRKGIAAVNPKEGTLGDVYLRIIPDETIMPNITAPGKTCFYYQSSLRS